MISRLKRIHGITTYWAPIIGGYTKAFLFFARSKFGTATTSAKFKNVCFRFRDIDLSAIDETLLRGEYDFIVPVINRIATPLIVDVGMNVGDFAVLAIATNPHSQIIGIEADKQTAILAQLNGRTNKGRHWAVYNRAAWSDNKDIFIETGSASVSSKVSEEGSVPVQGIDLRTIWTLLPQDKVDIMKIDIEGAEERFLSSQPELLNKVRHLIVEIHPQSCNEINIRNLLQQHFNRIEDIQGRVSSKPLLYCRKT